MRSYKVKDLFFYSYGTKLDLNKMKLTYGSNVESINFVARTSKNLGVVARVEKIMGVEPYKEGLITIALGGSILSSNIQPKPFYTAQNIIVLTPKKKMTFNKKLYYCMCIEKNRNKYSAFGREANKTLKDLDLPVEVPKWINNIKIPKYKDILKPVKNLSKKLETNKWKLFKYNTLFEIERGRGPRLKNINKKGKNPFITSIDKNNGWNGWTDHKSMHKKSVISVNRNGSIGEAYFQPQEFCSTEDVHILNPKFEMNPYIAFFIITLIKKEKYRYNFGRKWGINRMNETLIKLPIDRKGNPDWKFMEDYMKSLPYSNMIKN